MDKTEQIITVHSKCIHCGNTFTSITINFLKKEIYYTHADYEKINCDNTQQDDFDVLTENDEIKEIPFSLFRP